MESSGRTVSLLKSPAYLAAGAGLLAALAAVPFVSKGSLDFMPTKAGLSLTAMALAGQEPVFWLLVAVAVVWAAGGFVAEHRLQRPAV